MEFNGGKVNAEKCKQKVEHIEKEHELVINELKILRLKHRSLIYLILFQILILAMILINKRVPNTAVESSNSNFYVESSVLASVRLLDNGVQSSGVVISKGEDSSLILSSCHNILSGIGESFWVYFPDGSYDKAEVIAKDKDLDLSLSKISSKSILDHSYIHNSIDFKTDVFKTIGYSNGNGPIVKNAKYIGLYSKKNNKWVEKYEVYPHAYSQGDSGSGVFVNNGLIGIAGLRETKDYLNSQGKSMMYSTRHRDIVEFVKSCNLDKSEFGDWNSPSQNNYVYDSECPPAWNPSPNFPMSNNNFMSLEKRVKNLENQFDAFIKEMDSKENKLETLLK